MTVYTFTPIPGLDLVVDVPPGGLDDATRASLARRYASTAPTSYPRG